MMARSTARPTRHLGCEATVRFGRIGTNQTQTKTFANEAAAIAHVDKLIEEKTKKGYEEVDS